MTARPALRPQHRRRSAPMSRKYIVAFACAAAFVALMLVVGYLG
jgi:hypothetical protein